MPRGADTVHGFPSSIASSCYIDFTNLFLKWVYPFGRCLVELSSQYLLISGFYKLLVVCILKADERGYFGKMESSLSMKAIGSTKEIENPLQRNTVFGEMISQQDRDLCKDLFHKYLQEVLISNRHYKLELLVSCLWLCLSSPSPIINIESLVGPMISALKIGLRHCPLAMVAMDSLETWHPLHPNKLGPWLQQIVPYFNSYLIHFERKGLGEETINTANDFNGSSRIGWSKKLAQEIGRSRDFGFVSFTSNEEVAAAITGMDGKDLHGRLLHVNYAGGFRSSDGGYSQNDGNASGGSYSQSPSDGYGSQSQSSSVGYDGTSEGRSTTGTKDDFGYDDDESKWAITTAGGIPPFVQILEIGSSKTKGLCNCYWEPLQSQ